MTALSQELELLIDSLRTTQQPDRALLLSAANALERFVAEMPNVPDAEPGLASSPRQGHVDETIG